MNALISVTISLQLAQEYALALGPDATYHAEARLSPLPSPMPARPALTLLLPKGQFILAAFACPQGSAQK